MTCNKLCVTEKKRVFGQMKRVKKVNLREKGERERERREIKKQRGERGKRKRKRIGYRQIERRGREREGEAVKHKVVREMYKQRKRIV